MNPRLIGGEMLLWSDLAGGTGPVRGGAIASFLTPFLATSTGRTLIAGPHDPSLVTSAPGLIGPRPTAQTAAAGSSRDQQSDDAPTFLLRGVPDAEALADRFRVLCGGPGKLAEAGDQGWDTVVALDGLGRLGSAEDPEPTWAETFEQLLSVLRPGGTLLLGLENLFGLHRLVAMPPALTDADWTPAADYDETRPANLAAAQAGLRAAGLVLERTYATFPTPTAPAALIDTGLLTDRTHRGYVEALLNDACAPLDDTLTDPRRLAINAVRHGQAGELAPGWILVAHRAAALPEATDHAPITDPGQEPTRPTHHAPITAPGQEPTRPTDPVIYRGGSAAPGGSATRLTVSDLCAGDTLESLLLAAALRRDLPRMRALLTAWQSSPAAAVPATDVIVADDGFHQILGAPGTPESALHAFAVTVLSGGFAHPWPAPADAVDLTITLAAMAGIEVAAEAIPAQSPRPSMLDLLADRERLTRELEEAHARHAFYERTVADRDRALVRERQINALLSTTKPARALLAGARVARRTIRRLRS